MQITNLLLLVGFAEAKVVVSDDMLLVYVWTLCDGWLVLQLPDSCVLMGLLYVARKIFFVLFFFRW